AWVCVVSSSTHRDGSGHYEGLVNCSKTQTQKVEDLGRAIASGEAQIRDVKNKPHEQAREGGGNRGSKRMTALRQRTATKERHCSWVIPKCFLQRWLADDHRPQLDRWA